jgi:hypothetical protein
VVLMDYVVLYDSLHYTIFQFSSTLFFSDLF